MSSEQADHRQGQGHCFQVALWTDALKDSLGQVVERGGDPIFVAFSLKMVPCQGTSEHTRAQEDKQDQIIVGCSHFSSLRHCAEKHLPSPHKATTIISRLVVGLEEREVREAELPELLSAVCDD